MKGFRLAVISDIHLGHRRTPTNFIIDNLNRVFSCDKFFASVDMITFAGDVYDSLLLHNSEDSLLVDHWIARVTRLAIKHNVLIRVLEGTDLHDRKQPKRFAFFNEVLKKSASNDLDLKYVDEISIEHIERFGIDVLYIPDECNGGDTDKTLVQVREVLDAKGLSQVDFGFFHGAFSYQIPFLKPNKVHNKEAYEEIVKRLIYIGHVHTRSTNGKIVAQGSFDRLRAGEEEAKGFVRSVFKEDGTHQTKFIDNAHAKLHSTLICNYDDMEDSLKYIDSKIKDFPSESYIRIMAKQGNPILSNLRSLQERWPIHNWSIEPQKKTEQAQITELIIDDDFIPLSVTSDNISGLLLARISAKGIPSDLLKLCESQLKEVLSQ